MQRLMVLCTTLVLLSWILTPVSAAQAQVSSERETSNCLSGEPDLLNDHEIRRSLPAECIVAYKKAVRQGRPSAGGRDAQPMAAGKADEFGYTYDDAVNYAWISATTDSGLTGYDRFSGPIDLGFDFPFYGMLQTQLYFNTNGAITFGAGHATAGDSVFALDMEPNNVIAPYLDYLVVGSPYNSGGIYYSQGGTAPNRHFVVEWRNVTLDYGGSSTPFSFEAILRESGEIVFKYQSLPEIVMPNAIGIEDSVGDQMLEYLASPSPSQAIRFVYPGVSTARLSVSPTLQAGGFASLNGYRDFPIKIINPGTQGSDVYDLTASSDWTVTFYASNGTTPLTDTDGDSMIDTGPLAQGSATTVIARILAPAIAQVGDWNTATVNIRSSLDLLKTKTIELSTSIPADFVRIFQNEANGAMSFMTVQSSGANTWKATADQHSGHDVAVTQLANNNYFYTWYRRYYTGSMWMEDIEYAIFNRSGALIRPATRLIDNSAAAITTQDSQPAVAAAPDGTVGISWIRYKFDEGLNKFNYNVFFATLDSAGSLLTGPTNITNNAVWSTNSDPEVTRFYDPAIAATDENNFVIGWSHDRRTSGSEYDIWYAIRNSDGENVYSPRALTSDHASYTPVLNRLAGGRVILTWYSTASWDSKPQFAVISSNGLVLSLPESDLGASDFASPDAVQLPNGKIALAWVTQTGVGLGILNSSYVLEGESDATLPVRMAGDAMSVTTDPSSNVIMTWATGKNNHLYYALADSTAHFLTVPMIYQTSGSSIDSSWNGQGSAPFSDFIVEGPDIVFPTVLSIVRKDSNHTSADSVAFKVTFSEPVLDVTAADFALSVGGNISGATIQSVSDSGSTRTVIVNTGAGNGSVQLQVPANATITDLTGDPIDQLPFTRGEIYTILKSSTFIDVQDTYWAWQYVERLYLAGITGGCSTDPLQYCPETAVTRDQMAVFLLRGIHGSSYNPPAVGGGTGFTDVPTNHWAAAWIKQLAAEGITVGCGGGNYCPGEAVTRDQMAVFLLKAKHGNTYTPLAVGGGTGFTDVPSRYWAAAWIKQLATEGITGGCGEAIYCPGTAVNRAQMAVFLVKTFNLP